MKRTLWSRLQNGEIVSEQRIAVLVSPPSDMKGDDWREQLYRKNRENICQRLRAKGYTNVTIVTQTMATGEETAVLSVDGETICFRFQGTWVPTWDIQVIERILQYRKK